MTNPSDKVNSTKNFTRAKGKTELIEVTFAASVAVEEGSLVYPNPAGTSEYIKADSTAGSNFGVIRQTIAATDANYASTKKVLIEVPRENNVEWYFTVGAWTFTTADENAYVDLQDEKSVNVDASSKKQIFIRKYISATKGTCILAGNLGSGLALPATT